MLIPRYRRSLKDVITCIDINHSDSEVNQVTYVRNWVNVHSVHCIDEEHDGYAFDVPRVFELIRNNATGHGRKPHLSCGPRTYVMKSILDRLSVKSRVIDIFAVDEGIIRSHTLLEVYDKKTRKWYLQDPDFNVAYQYPDGTMLSALELMYADKKKVQYKTDGYNIENELNCSNTIRCLFKLGVLYRHSYVGQRSLLIWNVKKASITINEYGKKCSVSEYFDVRDFKPAKQYIWFDI